MNANESRQERPLKTLEYAPRARGGRSTPFDRLMPLVIIPLACLAVIAAIVRPMFLYDGSPRGKCESNMRQLGMGTILYAAEHGGSYPPDLAAIVQYADGSAFVCPSTSTPPPKGPTTQAIEAKLRKSGGSDYIYVGKGLTTSSPSDAVVLYEPLADHGGNGMNVVFVGAQVRWIPAPQCQSILQQAAAGVRPIRYPLAPATQSATSQ